MKNDTDSIQQLTLLPTASVPAAAIPAVFRLSEATKRRGMRHIAEIRAQLAASETETVDATIHQLPIRPQHPTAA